MSQNLKVRGGYDNSRRRSSYAAPGQLYDIPDNDHPIDFKQEQALIKNTKNRQRRLSVPATRTTVGDESSLFSV